MMTCALCRQTLPKGGWTAETLQNDTLGCGFAGTQA